MINYITATERTYVDCLLYGYGSTLRLFKDHIQPQGMVLMQDLFISHSSYSFLFGYDRWGNAVSMIYLILANWQVFFPCMSNHGSPPQNMALLRLPAVSLGDMHHIVYNFQRLCAN